MPLVAQNTLAPEKIVSLAVCTKEFLEGAPGSFESFAAQLQAAVVTASDAEFLTDIAATNNDVSSGVGTTSLADIQTDILLTLLPQVNYGPASSLFLVVGRDHARAMTMACMAAGISTMGFLGGVFGGLRTIVTDSLPANTISIIDATGLAVATTPITVRSSDQATLELATSSSMASGPSVTASGSLVSLFQTHSVGILVERSMAFAPLRPNAYASLSSIGWGTSINSPLP